MLTQANARTIAARAFAALEKEFGVGTVQQERGMIGETHLTVKMKITPGGVEVKEKTDRATWEMCTKYGGDGLKPEDFGRKFLCKSKVYEIVGFEPRKPKYCVRAKDEMGKILLFPGEQTARALAAYKE